MNMNLSEAEVAEVTFMVGKLQTVLGADNDARKEAEAHLNKIKTEEPAKYAVYFTAICVSPEIAADIRALAAVILRRSIGTVLPEAKETLWEKLEDPHRNLLKEQLLVAIQSMNTKDMMHKMSNLLVEVAGSIYELNEEIWQDLLTLVFKFINSDVVIQIDGGLQILDGLFSYIIDHMNKYKDDLKGVFQKTMAHDNLDIKLASLQALSNYL